MSARKIDVGNDQVIKNKVIELLELIKTRTGSKKFDADLTRLKRGRQI